MSTLGGRGQRGFRDGRQGAATIGARQASSARAEGGNHCSRSAVRTRLGRGRGEAPFQPSMAVGAPLIPVHAHGRARGLPPPYLVLLARPGASHGPDDGQRVAIGSGTAIGEGDLIGFPIEPGRPATWWSKCG